MVLYGTRASRTQRVLWMLAEVGVDAFEHRPLTPDDPALKDPSFLALNPAGAVPVWVDEEVVVAESLAINLYLARVYGGPSGLRPDTPAADARAVQWSLFAQQHLEPWVQKDARLAAARAALGRATGARSSSRRESWHAGPRRPRDRSWPGHARHAEARADVSRSCG